MGKRPNLLLDRYRTQARLHASARSFSDNNAQGGILPTYTVSRSNSQTSQAGGLNHHVSGSDSNGRNLPVDDLIRNGSTSSGEKSRGTEVDVGNASTSSAAAPSANKSEDAVAGDPAIGSTAAVSNPPPSIGARLKGSCIRFGIHTKNALFHSWVNVLLIAVPAGIAAQAAHLHPAVVFAINAVAIVPLAGLLAHATESVAVRLGDTLGALLNVSFGNAVELIIFIIALVKNEIAIVQASILGSILANLLLILGMAFLLGGLRYQEQVYNNTVTQMSACLLSLSVMSLLLPTAFHASFNDSAANQANTSVLQVSRGTSVVLLIVYVLYLLFQLKSHAYMYESTPQEIIDEESHPGLLADIMNSSSSSDDSSDSDSSDSSAAGSIITTGRKVKRMFKNRRRRKSSATASTVTSPGLSAPSTTERPDNYWESQIRRNPGSRRPSAITNDETDVEPDADAPRIRDFGDFAAENERAEFPEVKRSRKHKHRRYRKSKHRHEKEMAATSPPLEEISEKPVHPPAPKVEFDDHVQVAPDQQNGNQPSQSRLPFNVRQLSSRNVFRPALPKMLSNNVFVQPAPTQPALRPTTAAKVAIGEAPIRRTNSLPGRLPMPSAPIATTISRTEPLPPFQHQRAQLRQVLGEGAPGTGDDDEEPKPLEMSRTAAVVLLLCSTVLVAICAEFMVDAIPGMIADSPVSQAFIGLIILPIVGNAAEHVTAVTVAAKNKMDLAIGIAVGSSIQIALFVTPLIVLLGWILGRDMSLYFNIFDTVCLFVTAFVVNFLVLDGRSNYLEGSLLIAAYVIIALGAFFYPATGAQSTIGGGAAAS